MRVMPGPPRKAGKLSTIKIHSSEGVDRGGGFANMPDPAFRPLGGMQFSLTSEQLDSREDVRLACSVHGPIRKAELPIWADARRHSAWHNTSSVNKPDLVNSTTSSRRLAGMVGTCFKSSGVSPLVIAMLSDADRLDLRIQFAGSPSKFEATRGLPRSATNSSEEFDPGSD